MAMVLVHKFFVPKEEIWGQRGPGGGISTDKGNYKFLFLISLAPPCSTRTSTVVLTESFVQRCGLFKADMLEHLEIFQQEKDFLSEILLLNWPAPVGL